MRNKVRQKYTAGFTLIELMIASLVSVVLSFTLVQLLFMSFNNSQISNAAQSVNFSGQQGTKLLSTVIRKAGYEGCKPPSGMTLAVGAAVNANPANLTLLIDAETKQFPMSDFTGGAVQGYRVGAGSFSPALPPELDAALLGEPVPRTDTDMLAIYYTSQDSSELATDLDSSTEDIELVSNNLNLARDDYAYIGDCFKSAVFQVTNAPASKLQHNGLGTLTFKADNAQVRRAIFEVYYIGDTTRVDSQGNPIYSLYRLRDGTAEEMIPHVTILRFRYRTRTALGNTGVYNTFASIPAGEQVIFIQAGLMVISETPVLTADDPLDYDILNTNLTAAHPLLAGYERFYKKVYTLDVFMRNGI